MKAVHLTNHKKSFSKIMSFVGQLFLILSLVSCASTTTIQALNAKGAPDQDVKIYVEGMLKGSGQAQYSDMKPKSSFFNSTVVQLKKEGCKTQREELKVKMNLPKFIGNMALGFAGGGLATYWSSINPLFDSTLASFALAGVIIIAAIIPSLWVNEYKPLHSYDFHCEGVGG